MTPTPAGMAAPEEAPEGLIFSRIDMTWLTPEEAARRRAEREARAARRRSSNRFPCPYYAPDTPEHTVGYGADVRVIGSRPAMRDFCEEFGVVPDEPHALESPDDHWARQKADYDAQVIETREIYEQMDPIEVEPLVPDEPDEAGVIDASGCPVAVDDGRIVEGGQT